MTLYPEPYIQYLVHFHGDRDWFECHELLEEYWKAHPEDPKSRTWVGLIQVAVGLYHERRGNRRGAVKMLKSAELNLNAQHMAELGLKAEATFRSVMERRQLVEAGVTIGERFLDLNLTIADPELLRKCLTVCSEQGLIWGAPSQLENEELIHRHTRRDRSDVIAARAAEAERRRQMRQRGSSR
ncbi:DUF309 domain-containing protein [Paenibacillus koleovorans]|uniref:DUF309 domain-containing protein n=1 Tax=Paenibacillus koleovorans TaxID=121608 RepID=UPI000FDA4B5B|nr:DUF309 domain-containing protein [Paenibacillus koleovorans]